MLTSTSAVYKLNVRVLWQHETVLFRIDENRIDECRMDKCS